jgi:O-acetyl-ADP-ribose deacetylase (regulator of RNase III)
MPITYLRGDATDPQTKGVHVIPHICNTDGKWGAGFVLALSKRWPQPEACYREWSEHRILKGMRLQNPTKGKIITTTGDFALGQVQLVQVTPDTYVANMIAQQGLRGGGKGPPIRYEALADCLRRVEFITSVLPDTLGGTQASIHMPKIGTGLAQGDWRVIEPLIQQAFQGRLVYVYEYGR